MLTPQSPKTCRNNLSTCIILFLSISIDSSGELELQIVIISHFFHAFTYILNNKKECKIQKTFKGSYFSNGQDHCMRKENFVVPISPFLQWVNPLFSCQGYQLNTYLRISYLRSGECYYYLYLKKRNSIKMLRPYYITTDVNNFPQDNIIIFVIINNFVIKSNR